MSTTVAGFVRHADNSPVVGASVRAGAFGSGTTNANGAFSVPVQVHPGRSVRAQAKIETLGVRYAGASPSAPVVPGGVTAVGTIFLEPDPFRFPSPEFPTGPQPSALATGDFDEDGLPDVATTTNSGDDAYATVLLGVGQGAFGTPASYSTGELDGSDITAGDLDGDGHVDLAITHDPHPSGGCSPCTPIPGTFTVLLGLGDGTFVSTGSIATGGDHAMTLTSADLDGDLDLDLVVGQFSGSAVATVLLGNGDGSFGSASHYVTSTSDRTLFLATRDVNSDGELDLLATTGEQCFSFTESKGTGVSVLLGNGDGTFGPASRFTVQHAADWIAGEDLDGDTYLDLIVGGSELAGASGNPFEWCQLTSGFQVYLGSAAGTFSLLTTSSIESASATLADLDGDSTLDLILGQAYGTVVLSGNGDGTFGSVTQYASAGRDSSSSDVDGDGDIDILGTTNGGVVVLENDGEGGLLASTKYDESTHLSRRVWLADFNGDGRSDAAVFTPEPSIPDAADLQVHLGDGLGSFTPSAPYSAGWAVSSIAADFDGDSSLDLAFVYGSSGITVFLGEGDGTFGPPLYEPTGTYPKSIVTSDFDEDGAPDLAVARKAGTVQVFLGNGDGDFAPALDLATSGTDLTVLLAEDLDHDDHADLIAADRASGNLFVFLGNGAGAFSAFTTVALGGMPDQLSGTDLDGDGDLDLVAADRLTRMLRIVLGNGDGTFGAVTSQLYNAVPPEASNVGPILLTDLDGDGFPDAAVPHNDRIALLPGDGQGGFGLPFDYSCGSFGSLGAADLDGDSDLDLVASGINSVVLLMNPRSP